MHVHSSLVYSMAVCMFMSYATYTSTRTNLYTGLKLRANAHLYRPPGAHWAPLGVLANSTEMYLAHLYETPDNVVVV